MINEKETSKEFGKTQKIAYTLAYFPEWLIISIFQVWVFTFYFSAVRLPIFYILIATICFSVWNAINDLIIGYLSDRTKTRWGRRKPYIMLGTIFLIIISIITWIPPVDNNMLGFIYLLIILIAFDTFYTMLEVPLDCIFPELYTTVEERAEVNYLMQIFSVVGLLVAFLLPGILIEDYTVKGGYLVTGIIISIIFGVIMFISLKWGIKERGEFWDIEHADDMKKILDITGHRPVSGSGPIILEEGNNLGLSCGFDTSVSYYNGKVHEIIDEINMKLWKSLLERVARNGVQFSMLGDLLSRVMVDIGAYPEEYYNLMKSIKKTLDPKFILSRGKFNFW